jgi:hypothetical protein
MSRCTSETHEMGEEILASFASNNQAEEVTTQNGGDALVI